MLLLTNEAIIWSMFVLKRLSIQEIKEFERDGFHESKRRGQKLNFKKSTLFPLENVSSTFSVGFGEYGSAWHSLI